MRRLIPFLLLGFATLVLAQDGPLTNGANIPIRTDTNGYLIAASQTYTGPDGPRRVMANTLLRTDANGYLIVTNPTGFGSPLDAQYWVGAANASLTAEKNLGVLATALVINTAGVPSAYAGVTCTNQFIRILSAVGAGTCASVSLSADVSSSAFTAGSVLFSNGTIVTQDNTNFNYNDAGNTLNVLNLDFVGGGHMESENGYTYISGGLEIAGGNLALSGTLTIGPNIINLTEGSATGKLLLRNGAETTGVVIDVSTDAIFKLRTRADSADASLTALTGSFVAASLASAQNALLVSGTLSSTAATQTGLFFDITTAGSGAQRQRALQLSVNAGYTGISSTYGISINNGAASTGGNPFNNDQGGASFQGGNLAVKAIAEGTTTGANTGTFGSAYAGDTNFGAWGQAVLAKNGATNIGVAGWALNTGTTPVQIGGFFALTQRVSLSLPTFASAALMADNDATTSDILVARDNGTAVFTISDGGHILIPNLVISRTAPTIASGGCTSPAITSNNGTAAFLITIGTSCTGIKTITLTMPAASNLWACSGQNNTSDAAQQTNVIVPRATSTTAVVLTSYDRVLGVQEDFTDSNTYLMQCLGE